MSCPKKKKVTIKQAEMTQEQKLAEAQWYINRLKEITNDTHKTV